MVVPFNLVSSGISPPSILNPRNIEGDDVAAPAKQPKKSVRDALFIALGVFAATVLVFASIWLSRCLRRRCCRTKPRVPVGLLNEDEG